ncbi:hypothetical protein ACTI_00590 [Actinoplanes sp. OR16]|uniref:hypothetical protein n=1 Tax=Actinoplanes sp. OR16 TaxID=946334 RepID=UPI000F6E827A|nr:hypothetical protein [Actinoplanes sp. OR16]BBH63374.1 hypothetical protein ACTI_00590 [Actinoplanes sp. OR16]
MKRFASKLRAGIVLTAAMVGIGVAVMAPSPALAAITVEYNTAVADSAPSDTSEKMTVAGSTAYYVDYGDKWYVKDTAADGKSAVVIWEYYINFEQTRAGMCSNKQGNGTWGSCNKEYDESAGIRAKACTYDFSAGKAGACSAWRVVKGEIIP